MAFARLNARSAPDHYEIAVDKNSFHGEYTTDSVIVTLSIALALYNSLEMVLLVLSTFRAWKGLYFWSLCICNFGVFAYATGIMLTYFDLGVLWLGKTILDIGWLCMVTCQSLVLYSRLNLVVDNILILRSVKWMIITVSCSILPIVIVLDFGSTYSGRASFYSGYYYIEQIQLIVISVEELVISGLYVWKAIAFLKVISKQHTRRIMWQLFAINIIIISMDIATVALEFLHYQLYQEGLKGFFYSVKLKLELNILSKLVDLVGGAGGAQRRTTSLGVIDVDTLPGVTANDLQREVSPMEQPNGWHPSFSKGIMEHITEDRLDQTKAEESPSNASNARDDSDEISAEIMRMATQQTSHSSRMRGRESDMWYAEMLRDMK
ncbi:hypothetical protein H2200_012209 [Cladophialophora chaetospira]|uniref:DUF7703 domain-containing protein n=1 Tax=Cladophialophora chaetospira TaxID=386627 RepID=A0AA38WYD4_9EURO|nr:hypothetical protein H2200_012209 [Cladophialophora chaetospira]